MFCGLRLRECRLPDLVGTVSNAFHSSRENKFKREEALSIFFGTRGARCESSRKLVVWDLRCRRWQPCCCLHSFPRTSWGKPPELSWEKSPTSLAQLWPVLP